MAAVAVCSGGGRRDLPSLTPRWLCDLGRVAQPSGALALQPYGAAGITASGGVSDGHGVGVWAFRTLGGGLLELSVLVTACERQGLSEAVKLLFFFFFFKCKQTSLEQL